MQGRVRVGSGVGPCSVAEGEKEMPGGRSNRYLSGPPRPRGARRFAAIDDEVARYGNDRRATVRPTWWIGSLSTALTAFAGSGWFLEDYPHGVWIERRSNGRWMGTLLGRFITDQQNTVWAETDTMSLERCTSDGELLPDIPDDTLLTP
jgi:hypothetical protein